MTLQVAVEVIEVPPVSVEVIKEGGVLVVEVIHPGPQGPASTRARRHDWSTPYDYLGTAPLGTADSAPAWRITRLTISSAGAVTATGTATNVTWTGRTGHIYT